jgi:hypothetical protein
VKEKHSKEITVTLVDVGHADEVAGHHHFAVGEECGEASELLLSLSIKK